MSQSRRLAAILAADVAGYPRLMGADEEGTLEPMAGRHRRLDSDVTKRHILARCRLYFAGAPRER
jgi:adenylate cyclase